MNSTLSQKKMLKPQNNVPLGTLYKIATRHEKESICLYTPHSESPKIAAERFLRMHAYRFAAGGYGGAFLRAQKDLELKLHDHLSVEFYYHLDARGILRVLQVPSPHYGFLRFEGTWFTFINQQGITPEVLYAVPLQKGQATQILNLSEHQERIQILEHFCAYEDSPARFKAYKDFVAECKALLGGLYV